MNASLRFSIYPAFILILFASVSPAAAQTSSTQDHLPAPATSVPDYGKQLWDSAGFMVTSPGRWDQQDWIDIGVASAGVVGTAALVDSPLDDYVKDHPDANWGKFAAHFEKFGAEYSFATLGIFYADGLIFKHPRSRLVGEDGLTASILSSTITWTLKEVVGRSRPNANLGAFHFAPFSGNASFPSGHATQAFAVASVIAARYGDNLWVDTAAYGTATMVGAARIFHRAHFASDVLAGALIGNSVGRMVVRHHDGRRDANFSIAPMTNGKFRGLAMDWQY
jgi:membrane-associated phospholipid phosphatase